MNKTKLSDLLGTLLDGTLSAGKLTREQLDNLLDAIAKKLAPNAKKMPIASCYRVAVRTERFEYVCPRCGEKTIYSDNRGATQTSDANSDAAWYAMLEVRKLAYHRGELEKVKKLGVDASLDERAFCGACKLSDGFPAAKWALYLNVRLNGKTATTQLIDKDWEKLIAFLNGKVEWVTDESGSTAPLKPEIPRIRALLGLEEKTTEEETAAEKSTPDDPAEEAAR